MHIVRMETYKLENLKLQIDNDKNVIETKKINLTMVTYDTLFFKKKL